MKLGDEPGFIGDVHNQVEGQHGIKHIILRYANKGIRTLLVKFPSQKELYTSQVFAFLNQNYVSSTDYYVLVFPYLQYCITVWASTYPSNLNRIVLIQKRVITVISKEAFNDPHFSEIMYFEIYRCLLTSIRHVYAQI